jgi:tetratricopeptide (TPR) repeat protein
MSRMDGLLAAASARMEALDFGSAIDAYRRILQQVPSQAAASMGLAIAYNRVGRPADALPLLGRLWAVATRSNSAQGKVFKAAVLAQIGYAQQQLGQFKLAHDAFDSAHQLTPSDELRSRLAALSPHVNNQDPLEQLLRHARKLEASSQPDEALMAYRAAAQLRPNDVSVLQGTAWLLRRQGRHDDALPLLQKALVLAPDRPELHNDMGVLFQDRGDFAKAITFHRRALRFNPRFTPALINIGVAQKRLGRNEEAIEACQAALGIDADLPEAHNNLGNLFRLQRKHAQAFRHIQRALQLRPDYADAQANWDELRQEVPRLFRATPAEPLSCPPGVEAVVAVSAARKAPAKAPLRARRTPRAHAQPEIVTVPVPVTTAPARASASAGAGARPADGKARAGKHATRQSVCAHEGRK